MGYFIFLLIPLTSFGLMFLRDSKRDRKITLSILMGINAVFYLFPALLAFANTPDGESMWNENTGGGAALWLYIFVLPLSAIFQFILIILKIVNAANSSFDKKDKDDDVWRRKKTSKI